MNPLVQFIYDNGLIAMCIIIMLEYACFPVSSEIVLPLSGAVAAHKGISFFIMILCSVIAGSIGTSFCYSVGRFGGNALIGKLIRKFPKTEKGINSSYDKFNRFGSYAVCIGRMIPICRTYIAFIAGAAKQPFSVYFSYSFLGITIWNIILIGIGYTLGDNWTMVSTYYNQNKFFIILAVMLLALFFFALKFRKKKTA